MIMGLLEKQLRPMLEKQGLFAAEFFPQHSLDHQIRAQEFTKQRELAMGQASLSDMSTLAEAGQRHGPPGPQQWMRQNASNIESAALRFISPGARLDQFGHVRVGRQLICIHSAADECLI